MASRGLWHFMSARTRRSLALSWSALFVLSLLLQYFSFAVASPVAAYVGTPGGSTLFELDGNATDSNSAALAPDDWDRIDTPPNHADSKVFIDDGFNLGDDIFTGGGSKDPNAIGQWAWKIGSVQDKDDIENAFAAAYTGTNGHTFVYFGLDRYQTSGDATAGFWFLKSPVGKTGDGSGNGSPFSGGHTVGDILVVLDFSNGGSTATAQIYTWNGSGLTAGASGTGCTAATVQNVCAIANTTSQPSPWVYDDKSVIGADNDFPANALFEGGIDLSALELDTGCFSTFIAETRSSTSTTATLSDFAIGSFSLCATPDISTQVKKDGTSTGSNGHITIGDSVTDTVTITGSKGTPTGTVDFWHCFSASSTPTCTVPASGTPFDTKTLSGGTATSKAFTPTAVGNYCFIVDYHPAVGSHYLPGSHTNSTTECFVVDKQPTSITTSADETVDIGGTIHDTAVLHGATADATGTITFRAWGPGAGCSGTADFTSTATVVGGTTTYQSDDFTPLTAGAYHWIASYGGDAKNEASTGVCLATGENDTVNKVTPSISTQASDPNGIIVGGAITDTATVSGGHSPTGTVTFRLYGPDDATCANPPIFTSADRPLSGGQATSAPYTTADVGTYIWIATYNGDANNTSVAGKCADANESVVVNPTNPTIVTTLVGGGQSGAHITVPLGTAVHDTSVLSNATADATGTVHYQVFTDALCDHLLTDAGSPALVNGQPVSSINVTFNHAGTFYWQADYSGDANNNPATSKCNLETVTLDKAIPTITTNASATVVIGKGDISDTATLAGGFNATGSITFNLYDNETCTGTPIFTSTVTVAGNDDYLSGLFTPTHAGTYHWIAIYSGDGDNASVQGDCGDTGENVIVQPASPTVTTNASDTVVVGKGDISDTATLAGGFNPTGSITFTLFDNAQCSGTPLLTSTVTVAGNDDYVSDPYTPTHAGTYYWIANYSGDANNDATTNGCGEPNENVIVQPASPTVTTNASDTVVVGKGDISDTATLAGGFNPTGSITFTLFDNAQCSGTPLLTSTVTVAGNDDYVSDPYTPTHAGTYYWIANYSGDANNDATTNGCGEPNESVIVTPASPVIVTSATVGGQVGDLISDTATVSGGFNPTGTVDFRLYNWDDPNCDGSAIFTDLDVALGLDGTATSGTFQVIHDGTYHWVASYSGDANNDSATGACGDEGETTTIRQFAPSITTSLTSGQTTSPKITVVFGSSVTDQATLHDASPTAGGTVTYSVYDNATCDGDPIASSSKTVTNGVVPASDPVTFPNAGTFYWQASYGGDAANAPAISDCLDEVVTVTTPDLDVLKLVATGDSAFGPTSTANPGDVVHFKITVHNSGDADANDVPVSDDISAILAHATYNADCSNSCSFASDTLTWAIDVAAGATVTLTFSVTLDDTFPAGQTILPNVVVVTGPGSNCPPQAEVVDENCDTGTTVEAGPDLDVEKLVATGDGEFAGTSTAKPGDVVHYQITVHNSGNADANDVPVSDDISAILAHATYNDDCSNSCGFASDTLTWTIDVAAGATVTLTFSVTLDESFPVGATHLPNVVVVTGPGSNCPEASQDPDCDTDTTVTVASSSLTIQKSFTGNTAGTDPDLEVPAANIGDTLHYSLEYTGSGPLTNAVITDVLPEGLDYVDGSALGNADFDAGTYDPDTRTITWHAKAVLPDPASGTVTYDVKVLDTAPDFVQPLVNLATIDSAETAPDTDTASVAVLAPPEQATATPPATSTLTPEVAPSNPGFALMLILIGMAGLTLGIGFVTPAPERVRRRNRLG